jgi:hypothetical protein
MKRIVLSLIAVLGVTAGVVGTAHGDGPPPPPPNPGGGLNPPPAPGASATPTATATPSPTPTAIPLTLNVKIAHRSIKAGQTERVTVTSLSGAATSLKISFPGGKWTYRKSATLGASGVKTFSFKQPGLKAGQTNHTATVKVTVSLNGQQKHSTKTYTVS